MTDYCREIQETRTVRIWSKLRAAWWCWHSAGYTEDVAKAGLYTREEAQDIIASTHGENELREVGASRASRKGLADGSLYRQKAVSHE